MEVLRKYRTSMPAMASSGMGQSRLSSQERPPEAASQMLARHELVASEDEAFFLWLYLSIYLYLKYLCAVIIGQCLRKRTKVNVYTLRLVCTNNVSFFTTVNDVGYYEVGLFLRIKV